MRRYVVFGTVGVVLFLTSYASGALSVALPTIRSSFHTSLILIGWVMSGYLLTLTISVALGGRISDMFGHKPVFISCLLIFTFGTVLCSVAPNIELLILFRFIQGIGSGALASCSVAIVADEFPHARQRAIGLMVSIYPFGMVAGPNAGGWITTAWGWRSVFWTSLPLMAIAIVISALLLRPGKRQESQLDLPGAGMLAALLSAIMIGLSLIRQHGTPWIGVTALLIIGVIITVIFIRRESRVPYPIIDLEFLKGRPFAASNAYNSLYGACAAVTANFVPLYAVTVYHETTLKSGAIMTPRSLGMLLLSTITSVYVLRWGYRWPMLLGTMATGLSFVFLAIEPHSVGIFGLQLGSTGLILLFMGLSGLGLGAVSPAAYNACIDLEPQRTATIIGIRTMFFNAGGSLAVVAVSLVLNRSTDLPYGFYLVFMGLAVVSLMSIPLIFAMPRRARAIPSLQNTG